MTYKRPDLYAYRRMTISQLQKRVFVWDTGPEDERYFRNCLYELAIGKRSLDRSFVDFLWNIYYERSKGFECKYLYFNERAQRLYVDWGFQAWAEKAFDEIRETCAQKHISIR